MVVKHSKSLENIYESLDNLTQFFSSIEGGNSNPRIISMVEATLIKLERELHLETNNYRPARKQN